MLSPSFRTIIVTILLPILFMGRSYAQDMKAYQAQWDGQLPNRQCLSTNITVRRLSSTSFNIRLATAQSAINKNFTIGSDHIIRVKLDSDITFKGIFNKQQNQISGFIESGIFQYHLDLKNSGGNSYKAKWNILLANSLNPKFYLDVENGAGDKYEAYAFSGDPRFSRYSGFICYGFTKTEDALFFRDYRTGLAFEGKLIDSTILLKIKMAGLQLTVLSLHKSTKAWDLTGGAIAVPANEKTPPNLADGLSVANLHTEGFNENLLRLMVDSINANKITNTQSVLISRKGKLVYEQYFGGFDEATVHDLRSASKSISSAIIGIAMDKGILKDTSQKLFDLLPAPYQKAAIGDTRKQAISIGNLLTMSSGLDAIDFGIDRKSVASEDEYQSSPDWAQTVVNAPMINYPGTHANYSSANPYMLGLILASRVKEPLELFIDRNLFEPLGINNYIIQRDDKGNPYFGGGMFVRPRDMLKFGLLYANSGVWNHKQIISKKWIAASFKKYLILENHPEKNEYGFLWWHYSYKVNGKTITSVEARGAGGQYIFIVPEYDLVVVVTSGNFRNNRVWQPEKIMENYILPAVAGK